MPLSQAQTKVRKISGVIFKAGLVITVRDKHRMRETWMTVTIRVM